jgi:hypothetical protein
MTPHCANAQACDVRNPKVFKDEFTKKNPPGKKIMMLISFYGSLAGLPWSKCWNGMKESTRRKTTLSGMTREW